MNDVDQAKGIFVNILSKSSCNLSVLFEYKLRAEFRSICYSKTIMIIPIIPTYNLVNFRSRSGIRYPRRNLCFGIFSLRTPRIKFVLPSIDTSYQLFAFTNHISLKKYLISAFIARANWWLVLTGANVRLSVKILSRTNLFLKELSCRTTLCHSLAAGPQRLHC